jgi:HD-like signal output (HDOD) protein
MNALSVSWSVTGHAALAGVEDEVRRRKQSLLAILSEGLPTLPSHLFQLNQILASSPVDLKEVSALIRSDPSLTAQLLRLCNSALFGLRRRVTRVEEAAILLGTERLRNLVFACYLIQISCAKLSEEDARPFWTHAVMTAMLSERLSRPLKSEDADQAYLGGLLHDMGKLPLLMVAAEENSPVPVWLKGDGEDSLNLEREYFGLDHCEVGRWLGINWNFVTPLVEVLDSHHRPDQAHFTPLLAGTVAVADHFCERIESGASLDEASGDDFYDLCLPGLSESGRGILLGILRHEYPLMQRMLETEPPTVGANRSGRNQQP